MYRYLYIYTYIFIYVYIYIFIYLSMCVCLLYTRACQTCILQMYMYKNTNNHNSINNNSNNNNSNNTRWHHRLPRNLQDVQLSEHPYQDMLLKKEWSYIFHLHHSKTFPIWKHGNCNPIRCVYIYSNNNGDLCSAFTTTYWTCCNI